MPKKMEIDQAKMVKMINQGKPQNEIMDAFGFKNSSQLKVAYINALMEAGKVSSIKSSRGAGKSTAAKREVSVSKRGSLVIPKEMIAALGLKEGDTFHVRPTKAGLSLKKL